MKKVTALTLNDSLRIMLCDEEKRLNLRHIMDEGRILIVNVDTCDRETRDLIGSLLTVALEQAAMSRLVLPEDDRKPWFCLLDEFQRFVANEGSAQVLAQMLSEMRKMGLRLCLAHQGWHQLGNTRLEGASDQAQVKVNFGSGTKTARVVAEELFRPDPEKIKHQVDDPQAQGRTHPTFESLLDQKEMFVQSIHDQRRRQILVLPPEGKQLVSIRTTNVPNQATSYEQPEEFKVSLLRELGKTVRPETVREGDLPPAYSWKEDRIPDAGGIVLGNGVLNASQPSSRKTPPPAPTVRPSWNWSKSGSRSAVMA